jgi:glutamine amidotransferase
MITVVDYGMGNIRSVRRAFETLGFKASILVLPGVGAYGEAVARIDALNLRDAIVNHAYQEKPMLGICLGMQLFFERSEESPGAQGLAILSGEVKRFASSVKVPHIGWNDVAAEDTSDVELKGCFYFVHSYYVKSEWEVGRTEYGIEFSSVVQKGNTLGTQFHPEKSQEDGLRLLRSFVLTQKNER